MEILDSQIEEYLHCFLPQEDPLIGKLENYSATKNYSIGNRTISFPIVGPIVGRLLYQLTLLIQAKRVLELGSGFGYSATYFAKAMKKEGELILTDYSEENLKKAEEFLSKIPNAPKLFFRPGDALKIMEEFSGEFDIIFIDLDKELYPQAFHKSAKRIRRGGLLIADNTLWSGEVLKKDAQEPATRGIQEFNRLIFSSPSFCSSIVPIRDGVAVCLKIEDVDEVNASP